VRDPRFHAWVFTEMPYPYLPAEEGFDSVRVTLPNRLYDPEAGYELYRKYFDIYAAADRLGLDIMLNEHHSTATCLNVSVPMSAAIVARETRRARLLVLGNPVANRREPVRVAEEMAMADVLSRGRLEVGFVRGVPNEISAQNANPATTKERFWEAADLIVRAWTSHDGPVNWEGEHFHARQLNIWPRPYQQPHPPVWVPTQSLATAAEVAERQYHLATILSGTEAARRMFDVYREASAARGAPAPGPERFGYCGLVFTGETDEEGRAGARLLQWYLQHNKVAPQFNDPPGYYDVARRAELLARRAAGPLIESPVAHLATADIGGLIDEGMVFAGSPASVQAQITEFDERVGGCANLLMMVQAGTMSYETTVRSMELFATEVLPALRRVPGP